TPTHTHCPPTHPRRPSDLSLHQQVGERARRQKRPSVTPGPDTPARGATEMATSTDYDTPRRPLVELDESVPDLRAARSGQAPTIDVDDPIDDFELPGAEVTDLGDGELTVTVVP